MADDSLAKPACAPNAVPTGWASEVGMQIIVDTPVAGGENPRLSGALAGLIAEYSG